MTTPEPAWRDDFVLGYAPMDQTHGEFLQCVAAVAEASDTGLMDAFVTLKAHLQSHFNQEDTWMRDTDFPARECHVDEHAQVMKSVYQVEALLRQGDYAMCRRLANELTTWFPGHATYLDSALSHWMCKRQYGGTPVVVRRRQ
jgi:hemerythrin-like metal-binding protein